MQTFIPYPDYEQTALCLDPKRLGNQVYREGKTLLNGGWKNHPASKMWQDHEYELALYCFVLAKVLGKQKWIDYFKEKLLELPKCEKPYWMGWDRVHDSHKAALLYKDPVWYGQFKWEVKPKIDYFWPS